MNNSELPKPWPTDPLSALLANAQYNERATSLNMPDVYALLQRVHDTFEQVATITERENTPNLLPTRILMARARGSWLAAVRLGLSAQTVEAYPLVRATIEAAWYALHIAKDAAPPARAMIWLRRNDAAAAKARCKTEFTVGSVRATHAGLDAPTQDALHTLYGWTIEFGAHPNERGALTALTRTDEGDETTFGAVLLGNDRKQIALALKCAVNAAFGVLKVFRLIFPERFAIMGVDGEIAKLVDRENAVFAAYRAL